MEEIHKPVLYQEVLAGLNPMSGEKYLDFTAGYGGHADKILAIVQNYKEAVLVDRDKFACDYLSGKYENEPITIMQEDFYSAALKLAESGKKFNIILLDLGVSSPQLDRAERGFAFMLDGPLDMRMDKRQKLTAEEVVNDWSEKKIVEILKNYGEMKEGEARVATRRIIENRPIKTTTELSKIMLYGPRKRVHPATRVFQAIRIAVNDELSLIEKVLPILPRLLEKEGRVGIISFHSLEDRLVKNYFKSAMERGEESEFVAINKKPIVAENEELVINPRARSAKLRLFKRR